MDDADLVRWLESLKPVFRDIVVEVPTLAEMREVAPVLGLDVAGVARVFALYVANEDEMMDVLMPDGSKPWGDRTTADMEEVWRLWGKWMSYDLAKKEAALNPTRH